MSSWLSSRLSSWLSPVGIACLVVACGGAQPTKTPVAPAGAAAATPPETPDLSPVKRPNDVIVLGRVARPKTLVDTLSAWSSMPLSLEQLLPEEGRAIFNAASWDAPVDILVALDALGESKVPSPLAVTSLGLQSLAQGLDVAESMQLRTRKVAPGIYRVGDFGDASCAIAASVGVAPARLVCGRSPKDVDALLPYATRGLPTERSTGADIEFTLDVKPIHARYGRDIASLRLLAGMGLRQFALDEPRFDRALSDIAFGAIDETVSLLADLDQIRLEARIDAQAQKLLASGELKLRGETSWTAATIAQLPSVQLPPDLPRVPSEATSAAYSASFPADRAQVLNRLLADLLEGYLAHEKLPRATAQRARKVVETLWSKLPEKFAVSLPPSQQSDPTSPETVLVRYNEASARLSASYNDLFALLADPALKRWLKTKVSVSDKAWPKTAKKPLKIAGFKTAATQFEITINLGEWVKADPSVARALQGAFPNADDKQVSRLTFVVQPDGNSTYVATGADAAEITRAFAELAKNDGRPLAPASSETGKAFKTGFFTLAFLGRAMQRAIQSPEVGKAIAGAPQRGMTPMTIATTFSPGAARVDVAIPAAVFTDLAVVSAQAAGPVIGSLRKRSLQ